MDIKEEFSKVRGGDKDAFARIYNELKTPVFTVACRIVRSRETAEDITHDVFVKLFVSPPTSEVKNPRAWVFRMTRNLSLDALRKKRHADIEDAEEAAFDAFACTLERLDIERAIAKLPLCEREILSLHTSGLGFSETADVVGLSLPATYRKYRKAIKTVRDYLNGGAL
ncbi:MAG: sigma-70 family RNA polymerase sigma factor [Clostridia bacterium]|nr:sigma-70 family RNA polymerase sigma factor [Clostridia bacterium]